MFRFVIFGLLFVTFIYAENSENRIVGGTEADIREFPHQVSLHYKGGLPTCGGSILSKKVILTAAHCVIRNDSYKIQYGSTGLDFGGQFVDVEDVKIHEKYNRWDADIALLILKDDIKFSEKASSIELIDHSVPKGTVATLSGFGLLSEPGVMPKILQKLNVTVVNIKECEALNNNRPILDGICAGTGIKGQGACGGDSGSPLVFQGRQCGIAIRARRCAHGVPDTYTDVFHYKDWIIENMMKYQ